MRGRKLPRLLHELSIASGRCFRRHVKWNLVGLSVEVNVVCPSASALPKLYLLAWFLHRAIALSTRGAARQLDSSV